MSSHSSPVLGEFADLAALRAAVERHQPAQVSKHWIWLGAARADSTAAAAMAAVALGVGIGTVPLLKRLNMRLQALRLCIRRRKLAKRLAELRLCVGQLADDERRLFLRQRQALLEHGCALYVSEAGDEAAKRAE